MSTTAGARGSCRADSVSDDRSRRGNNVVPGPVSLSVAQITARAFVVGLSAFVLVALAGCDRKADKANEDGARPSPGETRPPSVATAASPTKPEARDPGAIVKVEVPEVRVRNDATTVRVAWVTPEGTAVNDDAPFRVRWNRSDGLVEAPNDVRSTGSAVKDGFSVKVQPMTGAPNATLGGEINIVVCDSATHSVCVPVRRSVELGFVVANDAAAEAQVAIPLPAAK